MPNTHNPDDATRAVALNAALLDWGYTEDFVKYQRGLDKNMRKAQRADVGLRTTWVGEMEDWLEEGESFADELYELASRELSPNLVAVSFNVLYMIAAVEARLAQL